MDSRKVINLELQLRSFLENDNLSNFVTFLSGKVVDYDSSDGADGVTGAFFWESSLKFFHQNKRVDAVLVRNLWTNDKVRACEQNELQKNPSDKHVNPRNFIQERNRALADSNQRTIENSIHQMAANKLSFATVETLESHLETVDEFFRTFGQDTPTGSVVNKRRDAFLNNYIQPGDFQDRCKAFMKTLRNNGGNRNPPKKDIDIDVNDAIVKNLYENFGDGEKQSIMVATEAKEGSLERNFRAQDYPKWKVFQEHHCVDPAHFCFEGFKNRLSRDNNRDNMESTKKKKNNTKHQKALFLLPEGYRASLYILSFG